MTMDTATERTDPIGTLILITDDEMRDILTHIAGAGDRELFDRLHDRWTSLRYGWRPPHHAQDSAMTGLTYSSGDPIRVGDTVRYPQARRAPWPERREEPAVLVEEARPTTDLGLDLPLTLEGTDR